VAAAAGGALLLRPKAAAADSIAVMPFANLSGDPSQAYFSDGIAEELRNALTRIARLKVVARTSCEKVKDEPATEAARKLGVATILTGSVRRSPSIIRVSAQLVDGDTGVERWSQTYDRAPGDALQIQTGIAESVAQALRIQLAPAERQALASGGTKSAAAHDLYLQGRAILYAGGSDEAELRQGLKRYDAALAADPGYVAALAARSRTLYQIANLYEAGDDLKRDLADTITTARRAVALDPQSGDAQGALAEAELYQMKLQQALERHQLAARLAPGDPDVVSAYCEALNAVGRADEAIPLIDRAIAQDPLNPRRYQQRARIMMAARRYADAIAAARQALALGGKSPNLHTAIAEALILTGKPAEALPEIAQIKSDWDRFRAESIARWRMGDRTASDRALADLRRIDDGSLNFQFAEVYAQRGEIDQAFAALDAAQRASDPGLSSLLSDALLDPLHGDPRFQALVRQLNFPTVTT
jgi:TolB-like protein/Tfp pilus assembly protein PilF